MKISKMIDGLGAAFMGAAGAIAGLLLFHGQIDWGLVLGLSITGIILGEITSILESRGH
jgi:hypothetical protein